MVLSQPHARSFENKSPALAFLAAVLGMMGISDLVTLSMPEEVWVDHHWATQGKSSTSSPPRISEPKTHERGRSLKSQTAPTRLFMSLSFVIYTFFFGPSSPLYGGPKSGSRFSHPSAHVNNPRYTPSTWGGDGLKNRVFLTFAFLEMLSWFWVWITLREEQEQIARKRANRRGSQSHGY